ncbi:helix-turn-helix domain-containing protein [Halobacteriales archaeon Cl-PHB]
MVGLRAELAVDSLDGCPVAEASAATGDRITDVRWSGDGEAKTEQFTTGAVEDLDDYEQLFDYGASAVYEFERDSAAPCFCEFVEEELGPVTNVEAREGVLHVTVHAGDVEQLRTLMTDLRDRFGPVELEYLVRGRIDEEDPAVVPVDLGKLTDRQRETVETAYEMGYFAYPRESNATEVAAELGIDPSTFAEHLAVAQGKLLDELLERA